MTKQMPIKIKVPVLLFFFIFVLLSFFHGFLSLSVSEGFAFMAGKRFGFPGAGDVVLFKRTTIELFDRIARNIGGVSVVDLNTHILAVMTDHNVNGFGPGTVALLLNLKSIFTAQVVAVFSNSKPGILNLLLFAGT